MRLVVITGASRSGTTFMGGLLNRASNAVGRHEFLTSRDFASVSYYNPEHPSLCHEIEERLAQASRFVAKNELFVDVNCNLTFGLAALRKAKPDVKIFHLVRDGRAVVTSNWARKMYTAHSKGVSLVPDSASELDRWDGYDRFQRLAWQWNHIVSHLRAENLPTIKLECVLEDYDYLKSELLDPAGIALSQADWESARKEKANGTRFKLRDWFRGRAQKLEWTAERHRQFDEICGASMQALGYSAPAALDRQDAPYRAPMHQQAAE